MIHVYICIIYEIKEDLNVYMKKKTDVFFIHMSC